MSDLPPIDYERRLPHQGPKLRFVHYLLIVGIAALIMAVLLPTFIPRSHDHPPQIRCASNLRQIGQAIQLYAVDNGGLFPPDLQTAASAESLGLECFVCRISTDTRAVTPAEFALPGHISYVYVGADLSTRSKPDCIIAVEDPANHAPEGSNVLFADGHVEFLDMPQVQHILNELNAGRNPPTALTPTLSQSAAKKDYQTNWKSRMPQLKSGVWRIPTTEPAK